MNLHNNVHSVANQILEGKNLNKNNQKKIKIGVGNKRLRVIVFVVIAVLEISKNYKY